MTSDIQTVCAEVLSRYPKTRMPLPEAYQAVYADEYVANRAGGGFGNRVARFLETWMHRQVAAGQKTGEEILELGAGTLNHLPWEAGFAAYDIIEPFRRLLEVSPNLAKVRNTYSDMIEVPTERQYDRIISIAVLEHILDLPKAVALGALHLKPHGRFSAGVPSEGAWLWEMAWKFGTGPGFKRRTGLDYAVVMHHEHVNTVAEIERCIRCFFSDVRIRYFPLPFAPLSLYAYIDAQCPDLERCNDYLSDRDQADMAPNRPPS